MTAIIFVLLLVLSPLIAVVIFAVFVAIFGAIFLSGGLATIGIGGVVSRVRQGFSGTADAALSRASGEDFLASLTEVTPPR
ncbi:hypothetical protein [Microbacterium sp. EST19A]|uniref:hypothetical protein n=1 Tax=Microbacterium sp. EST19A TaxID=2862681 RepID=UPI001CC04F3D|nr:hypothetical protein [Microbacterium sp. EST19A]